MNSDTTRALAAQALIVVAAVGAMQLMLVEPMRERADRARAAVVAAQERLDAANAPAPPASQLTLEDLRRLARWFDEGNRAGADPLRVYEGVMAIASRHGVQVDRLEPATPAALDRRPRRGRESADPLVATSAFELDATAPLGSFISFLDAIESAAGFARVTGFSFEPVARNGRPLVRASVRTSHFAFDLADAAALADGSDTP